MYALFILPVVSGMLCGTFSCYNFNQNSFPQPLIQQCINQVGGFFQLQVCNDIYFTYCSPNYSNTSCSLPPTTSDINIAYPGEPCTFDRNCLNSKCIKGSCKGSPAGSACVDDSQCDVQLFCTNSICTAVGPPGAQCSLDSDCSYNYGCYNNVCTKYFTIAGLQPINYCNDGGLNFLCASGACQIITSTGATLCVNALPTNGTLPKLCTNNDMCAINDGGTKYTTVCNCGFNQNSSSYCNLAPGDSDFVSYITYMKTWLKSSNVEKCHSTRRISPACIETYSTEGFYANLTYFQASVAYYPTIQSNDQCIKNIYTSKYWAAESSYQSLLPKPSKKHSDSLYLVIFGIFLILI